LKIAEAVPRSEPGNQAATIRALAGKDGDSARPTAKRIANSTITTVRPVKKPAKPCRAVKADQTSSAIV
jgi:hypothetical protein